MIILASQSEARRRLLTNAGITFMSIKPPYHEDEGRAAYSPSSKLPLALHLAIGKANSLPQPGVADLVIAADQTLNCEGQYFSKPKTRENARVQLSALRNKTHHLCSAIACRDAKGIIWKYVAEAKITMSNYSDNLLEHYLESAGSGILDCVGSYQYEGNGVQLIDSVEGDYHTILGLPLLPLLKFLRSQGRINQ